MPKVTHPPVMLVVLDGFGISPHTQGNAIALAKKPTFDLFDKGNTSQLLASGESVGLPTGQMGNSEVGHTNIGAGRIVYQNYVRINKSIESGEFFKNSTVKEAFSLAKSKKSRVHFLGLLSDGGIHSHEKHVFALLKFAKQQDLTDVFVHCFLDGRDTPHDRSPHYLKQLEAFMQKEAIGRIATLSGRFYAMDRDKRWNRIQLAYDALTQGRGEKAGTAQEGIQRAFSRGETDEFVKPTVIDPSGTIRDHDVVIFFNFRADRARQLSIALNEENFAGFDREVFPKLGRYLTMTEYHKKFTFPIIFPHLHLKNVLGEILAQHQIPQLRVAETEKYAHVTFFFNGGEETVFPGEKRILIPSQRDVHTYDLKPQMSAPEITDAVIQNIEKEVFGFILMNFANADMVGHTGNLKATTHSIEVIDSCMAKIASALQKKGGHLLITADHGNAEQMIDPKTDKIHTAHTTNPVPFYYVHPQKKKFTINNGILADLAPTILSIMNITPPKEITGKNLIQS